MRILMIYPYVPFPVNRGTYHRVFNLARELGSRHEIDLFCLDEDGVAQVQGHETEFEFCRRVKFHSFSHSAWPRFFPDRMFESLPTTVTHWQQTDVQPALDAFAADHDYDLIHFCDLVLWPYAQAVPSTAPRVMDRSRVDLLFQQEELNHLTLTTSARWLRKENLWKLRRLEKSAARELKSTVVCGPDDKVFMRREVDAAAEIFVLANGADPKVFDHAQFPPQPDPKPTVLFCGAMDYTPNIDGLKWYFEEADPALRDSVPDRQILIVGKSPVPEVLAYGELPGVTVTGEVPDVRPYYQRAWLQMVPLRIGGGTRLKIVESLAIGCPVVSTTIGAQGLDLVDGEHLSLADSGYDFAGAITEMLDDASIRERLADQGRQRTLDRYTWHALGEQLSQYYESLLPESPDA